MKIVNILIIISLLAIISCSTKRDQANNFTSSRDTLVLTMEKIKGIGLFSAGAGSISFRDTTEQYDYHVIFPKNITDIKLAWTHIDAKPLQFGNLKNDKSDYMKTFLKENFPSKIDTLNLPSIKVNSISFLTGKRGEDMVFIVDENNNKDFRDDSVRLYQKIDWRSVSKLIKCKYKIFNGKELVEDSSWINVGTVNDNDNDLWFFVSHHLESTFSIDNQVYQIGVTDSQSHFGFDEPVLALISQNGIRKDTLPESEQFKKGEYVKLKNTYYCFYDISNDGKYIILIKENDFKNKVGTQVGMIAPYFNCHSIDGDSISLNDFKGKYLLLINVSACWSKVSSYTCFKDLTEAYRGKLEFLGIDDSPVSLRNNIKNLNISDRFVIAEDNQMIRKAYRPHFCSRTCFLISPKGSIVDKFEIFNWKSNLARIFGEKN
jgi:peroxiredoxin